MPAVRCALCDRLLIVVHVAGADDRDALPVICDPCAALPNEERERRRDQAMTRGLWHELRAARARQQA